MARVTGPLLSLGASGQLGKTLVFGSWRGIPTARQLVVPANPKTTAQVLTRDIFRNLELRWKQGGPIMRAPWDRFAVGRKFVGRNAYLGDNIQATRGEADMAAYIGSPGAKSGLPATSLALTTVAANGIEAVVVAPAPPTGWTLTSAQCTFLKDQTPEAVVADVIVEGEDVAAPFSVDVVGLDAVDYYVQAWLKWLKDDGSVAYGASISDTILVT